MGRGFTMGSRVGHIGVQVTDMDRSLEFYTEDPRPHANGQMTDGRRGRNGLPLVYRHAP